MKKEPPALLESINPRKTRSYLRTPAHAVLTTLGFTGVTHFSKVSGLNHQTAAEILDIAPMKHQKTWRKLLLADTTLHAEFQSRKNALTKWQRQMVLAWAKDWRATLESKLFKECSILRCESPAAAAQREARQRTTLKKFRLSLKSLKWE